MSDSFDYSIFSLDLIIDCIFQEFLGKKLPIISYYKHEEINQKLLDVSNRLLYSIKHDLKKTKCVESDSAEINDRKTALKVITKWKNDCLVIKSLLESKYYANTNSDLAKKDLKIFLDFFEKICNFISIMTKKQNLKEEKEKVVFVYDNDDSHDVDSF